MKWGFSTYEVVTTIRGQSRYTELRNTPMRCIDDCTDQAILSFNLPLPTDEQVEWYATQTETLESFKKSRGEIMNENDFLHHHEHAFKGQLDQATPESGAHQVESCIPFTYMDKQRRLWNATWQERCCLTDQGGFCHAARRIHLRSPRCCRALQVAAHFSRLAEEADAPIVKALPAPQEPHSALPIVTAVEITSASAGSSISAGSFEMKSEHVIEMAQATEGRVLDDPICFQPHGSEVAHTNAFFNVVDGLFDFGGSHSFGCDGSNHADFFV